MGRSQFALSMLLLVGCSRSTPAPVVPEAPPAAKSGAEGTNAGATSGSDGAEPTSPPPSGARYAREPFGGERWGFVTASSKGGSLVFVRIFDGKPTFGHHGSASVASALHIFEGASGRERTVDELIDLDATRRYALVLDQDQLWLVDTDRDLWEPLPDADMRDDRNRCLPPRQATFSDQGKRVAWIRKDAAALVVRDLESRDQWTVSSKERLWRGWSDDDGRGVIVMEVDGRPRRAWPQQNTSCACRWCGRFALSYGFYGWSGPSFTIEHLAADGTRSPAEPPQGGQPWHGPNADGCTLTPAHKEDALEKGPWRWVCGEQLARSGGQSAPTASTGIGDRLSTRLAAVAVGLRDRG